jgi:hypothetical protein
LISAVINQSIDDNGYCNPMKVKLYLTLEVVYAYTNLSFTSKMKEDPFKLYDILVSTGIFNDIIKCINEDDWNTIQEDVWKTINSVYKYKNSLMGILESVKSDYDAINFNIDDLKEKLSNPEDLSLLKEVLSKLD